MPSNGRSSKSSLKINSTKIVTFRSSLLAFNIRETGLFERVSSVQIHFLLFLRYTSPAYEIPLNWWISPGVHRTLRLICFFPKYCFSSEKLVSFFIWPEFLNPESIFFHRNCLPQPSRVKFYASTPSESAVAPKSNLTWVGSAHEWRRRLNPGLSARYAGFEQTKKTHFCFSLNSTSCGLPAA